MIHNNALARAINKDRYRRGYYRRKEAAVESHEIRRAVGRWLETLGRRLQTPRPTSSSA